MNQGFAPSRTEKEIRHFIKVRLLTNITGATKLECEKALIECRGDVDAAIDMIRKKGTQKES